MFYVSYFMKCKHGDALQDSDWDILIVLDKERLMPNDYDTVTYPLTKLGWDIGTVINPIMYTRKNVCLFITDWQAKRHAGMLSQFGLHFIKSGIIEDRVWQFFDKNGAAA